MGDKNRRKRERTGLCTFMSVLFLFSVVTQSKAKPVQEHAVHAVVQGWLKSDQQPLGMKFKSYEIVRTEKHLTADRSEYYIVYIHGGGYVIVSGDDGIEPIIGFVGCNVLYDANNISPLKTMIERDIPERTMEARESASPTAGKKSTTLSAARIKKAASKWNQLAASTSSVQSLSPGTGSISDIRVAPLIQSTWWQSTLSSCTGTPNVYNYYTPGNYVCGCVATAMSQLMRFYQFPAVGVGTESYPIRVDGVQQDANLRGGDGAGGQYNWALMPLAPACGISDIERQAIGALCADAGIAARMSYTQGLSSATLLSAKTALTKVFGFGNAVWGNEIDNSGTMSSFMAMVNPNLDAGLPLILGVDGQASHAILADGYGYNSGTLYHHLNMGWGGQDNIWYNLPTIDASRCTFNTVIDCIYNIYIGGTGEIISGRVSGSTGSGIANVTISAQAANGSTYWTTTNEKGIYAFKQLPSNMNFTVSASAAGHGFGSQVVSTGKSKDYQNYCGNVWGVNFADNLSIPPIAYDNDSTSTEPGNIELITLQGEQNGQINPPGMSFIITSLPRHGKLLNAAGNTITFANLPYTISNGGSTISYRACGYYIGPDEFYFKVIASQVSSNLAVVPIDVEASLTSTTIFYEEDFEAGLPADWSIINGGGNTLTWNYRYGYSQTQYPFFNYMMVNSASAGQVWMDEQLVSCHFNFSQQPKVILGFDHEFTWSRGVYQTGDVDVSINGGSWQNVMRFQDNMFSGQVVVDISAYAGRASDVQIRWRYYNAFAAWYWCIDDVTIETADVGEPMKGDFDLNCGVDAVDLLRLATAWLSSSSDTGWDSSCDIAMPRDNKINLRDMAVLAGNWLVQQ